MKQVKDYLVTNERTGYILYSGNNAFKAHQAHFSGAYHISIKGQIQKAVINYITAHQERLN